MLCRYSRCTGETLRNVANDRSSDASVSGRRSGTSGTGVYAASGIKRSQLSRYISRAWRGI